MLDDDQGQNSINSENNIQQVPEYSIPLENQSQTPLNQIPPIQQSYNPMLLGQVPMNQPQMNLNYQQLNQPYYPPVNFVQFVMEFYLYLIH